MPRAMPITEECTGTCTADKYMYMYMYLGGICWASYEVEFVYLDDPWLTLDVTHGNLQGQLPNEPYNHRGLRTILIIYYS